MPSRSRANASSSSATGAIASSRRCTSTRLDSRSSRRSNATVPRASRRLVLPGRALVGDTPSRSGEIVVRVEEAVVGYLPGRGAHDADGRPASEQTVVARAPFLAAQRGERIGIVGPNGAGKTTLLRTIAGELPPLDGAITFGHNTQLGYLAQLRGARSPGRRSSMRCSRRSRSRPARRAAISRASCSAVTTCSRRSACCRAASGRASSWHCSASRHRTCCSSTSRPTTWISRPVRRSRGSSSSRRRPC